jgi:hypothetical protein
MSRYIKSLKEPTDFMKETPKNGQFCDRITLLSFLLENHNYISKHDYEN